MLILWSPTILSGYFCQTPRHFCALYWCRDWWKEPLRAAKYQEMDIPRVSTVTFTLFCTGNLSPTRVKASSQTLCIDSCAKIYFLISLSSTLMASIRPVNAQEFDTKYNYMYWGFCRIWWSPTPNLWIVKNSPWCMQSTTVRQLLYIGHKAFGWYFTLASSMSMRAGRRSKRILLYWIIIGGTMYREACSRTWCTFTLKRTLPNFTVCIQFTALTIYNYS